MAQHWWQRQLAIGCQQRQASGSWWQWAAGTFLETMGKWVTMAISDGGEEWQQQHRGIARGKEGGDEIKAFPEIILV